VVGKYCSGSHYTDFILQMYVAERVHYYTDSSGNTVIEQYFITNEYNCTLIIKNTRKSLNIYCI